LDIDIIFDNKTLPDDISRKLERIGYLKKGEQGIHRRFAFSQTSAWTSQTDDHRMWLEHHLYVCSSDRLALKNHLLFRDALYNNDGLGKENSIKIDLTRVKNMT